jgi:ATP-binding cassette, subfamily B, bacterial
MDQRSAFARARSFLNYYPVGKWSALVAGVGTGVLYVCLLLLLGLFIDATVNRGEIPAYHRLRRAEQKAFEKDWKDPLARFPGTADLDQALKEAGASGEKARWLAALADLKARLRPDKPGKEKSSKEAKGKEKPAELPPFPEAAALRLLLALEDLGVPRERLTELASSCLKKPDEQTSFENELRQELLWRVNLQRLLREGVGEGAAELLKERFKKQAEKWGTETALLSDLPDMGALGLIVRTSGRFDGGLIAWLASWNSWMWASGSFAYLTGLLIVAVVLGLLRGLCMYANTYMAALATTEAATRLRSAVYLHTYRLGTLAFRALGPAEAVGVLTRHVEAVHEGLYTWLTVVFREPVKFGLLLLFALLLNFWLALAFLLFAVLVWLVGGQFAAYFRRRGRGAAHRAADQLALLQESLMMLRLVKVYLMELFNRQRVERLLARYGAAQTRRYRGEAIYKPVLVFLGLLAVLVLLYIAGLVVFSGDLSVTSALLLATTLVSLYWPMVTWLDNRRLLRRGRESAVALFSFLDRPGGVGQVVEAEFLKPLAKQLEFDNVTLHEPGTGRKLLDGVSLTIPAGQKVALVGPGEMDRHALVYLIPRFLDPGSGEIRIDHQNLRWVTLDSLRAQIAIVLQHNLVFNDTVANNIGCGDPAFTLPKIIEAAKLAHAHQVIQRLPQGYETVIGEMGHALRIGEQFRIALARAILRDPALLIIEEPVIPLDENTKALLDDTFARVLPGRTTIFLPHRLSTIRNCDTVFLLCNGKIEAQGEHRELLKESELYRHLQYLEFNEFAGMIAGGPPVVGSKSEE